MKMRIKGIKKRYIGLGIVAVYALSQLVGFNTNPNTNNRFKAKDGFPLVISHGGSKELFPENTAYAFQKTMEFGVDVLELDLRMTKDDILVTHHNETIDETSDGTGKVNDYTFEELKKFNFGAKFKDLDGNMPYLTKNDLIVPMSLDELFSKYAKKVLFIIEIKDEGDLGKKAANQIKSLLDKYDIVKDVVVASFVKENNVYYKSIMHKDSITSASEEQAKTLVYSMYGGYDFAYTNYGVEGVQFPLFQSVPLDTSYLIYKMKKHNLFVHYWTINDEKTMKQLIDKKVDGIITDRPDLLIKLKKEYFTKK